MGQIHVEPAGDTTWTIPGRYLMNLLVIYRRGRISFEIVRNGVNRWNLLIF